MLLILLLYFYCFFFLRRLCIYFFFVFIHATIIWWIKMYIYIFLCCMKEGSKAFFRLTVRLSFSLYLSLLSNSLPLFLEIRKRSARFIMKCLFSSSLLVRRVMLNGVYIRFFQFLYLHKFMRYLAVRILVGWLMFFDRECEFVQLLLREFVSLRDGHLFLDGGCRLTRSELQCIIDCCTASYFFAFFLCTTRTSSTMNK